MRSCAKCIHVLVRRRNGDWYQTEFWQCFGCSVTFLDPERFTGNLVAGMDRSPRSLKSE